MQQEKFKVIGFIRDLINNVDKNLENFPKKDIEIKNRIRNASYDLLELAYEANTTEEITAKISIINKCIAKAKIIDFLVNLSYEKQIINNKRYIKFGESIDEIVKYLVGWKKSIKSNKEQYKIWAWWSVCGQVFLVLCLGGCALCQY